MAALRTQIYLSAEQRQRLDALRRARGESLAELIRDAVDAYLDREGLDLDAALEVTYGSAPAAIVPDRGEWERRVRNGG